MIDFNSKGFFSRMKQVENDVFAKKVAPFLVAGEEIVGTYKTIRDGVVFTNKRIIAINVQGITGKKTDYTSIPYSKITTFSVETAGTFDMDSELEVYVSAVGKVKFQFTGRTNVIEICQLISTYAL